MVTVCVVVTRVVVMLNLAVVCPTGTVTEAGVCAASLLLLWSVTVTPDEPVAAVVKLTVAITVLPPFTEVGFNKRPDSVGVPAGITVNETGTATDA